MYDLGICAAQLLIGCIADDFKRDSVYNWHNFIDTYLSKRTYLMVAPHAFYFSIFIDGKCTVYKHIWCNKHGPDK